MQNSSEYQKYWCPFGRISLQRISNGHADIISSGAFNMAVVSQDNASDAVFPSARCIGEQCPFFVPIERRVKDESMCRMAKDPSKGILFSGYLISFAITVAGLAVASAIIWVNILSKGV